MALSLGGIPDVMCSCPKVRLLPLGRRSDNRSDCTGVTPGVKNQRCGDSKSSANNLSRSAAFSESRLTVITTLWRCLLALEATGNHSRPSQLPVKMAGRLLGLRSGNFEYR